MRVIKGVCWAQGAASYVGAHAVLTGCQEAAVALPVSFRLAAGTVSPAG